MIIRSKPLTFKDQLQPEPAEDLSEPIVNTSAVNSISSKFLRSPIKKKSGRAPSCSCGLCPKCKQRKWVHDWRSRQRLDLTE